MAKKFQKKWQKNSKKMSKFFLKNGRKFQKKWQKNVFFTLNKKTTIELFVAFK